MLFKSFKQKNFRYFLFGESFLQIGDIAEMLVLAWVVLERTENPALLGIFAALRFLGTLASPFYGVWVDKYNHKALLLIGRFVFALMSFILLVLALTNLLEIWHLFIIITISGLARSFRNIMREVLTADVIQPNLYANAIGLTRSTTDLMNILGPLMGGFLLKYYGISASYILILSVYIGSMISGYMLTLPKSNSRANQISMWENLKKVSKYIKMNQVICGLLIMAFIVNFTMLSMKDVLLTVFAKEILYIGPDGLGTLIASLFTGAFIGSLSIAAFTTFQRGGRFLLISSFLWHSLGILLLFTTNVTIFMMILFSIGIFQSYVMVTMATLLIKITPAKMRGRVMGVRSLAIYGLPLGLLTAGFISNTFGAPTAMLIQVIIGLCITAIVTLFLRKLWYVK
ncbi:MAG: MFS transporter [SAR202 cluster bacterium]|nr:MFS transporter [SAR202 cluster bacterium]|tara:strand:- start:71 stop:1270 length:1200 start_codon:yes stop_codon:yes gene_type:complete